MKIKNYIHIIFFFLIFGSIVYFTDYGYSRLVQISTKIPYGSNILLRFDSFINEIDFIRSLKKERLSDSDIIDLKLSSSDLKQLNDDLDKILNSNSSFIRDEDKKWRKGKILVDGQLEKMKYKFHGTATTPFKKGGFSLRIKHNKQANYNELMRTFNLISSKDEPGMNSIFINNIANEMNLISSIGKMVIVRINGVKIGMFLMYEHSSKEWFEKEMMITNYAVIKSSDDWDTKTKSFHFDDTDLMVEDKEIKGSSEKLPIALGALDNLMHAIKNDDYLKIRELIDIDYMARFMALLTVINDSHQITGDNIKYIYDFTTGKFKILFRFENNDINNISNNIEDFNNSLFNSRPEYIDVDTHLLFKCLLKNSDFRHLRDIELYKITQDSSYLFNRLDKVYSRNYSVFMQSNVSRRNFFYKKNLFIKILKNNLKVIKQYLDYSKIYISINKTSLNQKLSIVNDSYHSNILTKINYFSTDSTIFEKYNFQLNAPILDENFKLLYNNNQLLINNILDIRKISFTNSITKKEIDSKHIYINYVDSVKYYNFEESIQSLLDNSIKYSISNDTIYVQSNSYLITKKMIFPLNYNVNIAKGTQFNISDGISILIQGSLIAHGDNANPVKIQSSNEKPYGTFAIRPPSKNSVVSMKHCYIKGGYQDVLQGVDYTGQISIHGGSKVILDNVKIENSSSDDGINIKNSEVEIKNSYFLNNFGDQIDLDYCSGIVINNTFLYDVNNPKLINSNRDGLDISGSFVKISNNLFSNFSDKGISVGEKSKAYIFENIFKTNNNGIVLKDASIVYSLDNEFHNNNYNYSSYIKKPFYSDPVLYTTYDLDTINNRIVDGKVIVTDRRKFNFEF